MYPLYKLINFIQWKNVPLTNLLSSQKETLHSHKQINKHTLQTPFQVCIPSVTYFSRNLFMRPISPEYTCITVHSCIPTWPTTNTTTTTQIKHNFYVKPVCKQSELHFIIIPSSLLIFVRNERVEGDEIVFLCLFLKLLVLTSWYQYEQEQSWTRASLPSVWAY